ncbi:hypothetical protein SDC9_87397 [bioreactor metagenome]|uniref:Uncharacterized protein n=1 Tax=bioreactor metagenome TaxID=1076179 RepID=A0A644ZIV3_9ZZZZ
MHQFIHDERCPGHVSRIFHKRDKRVQYHNVRQKNNNTPHSADNAVYQQILEWSFRHIYTNQIPCLGHNPLNPLHRISSKPECSFKHYPQKDKEKREPQIFIRQDSIEHSSFIFEFCFFAQCLFECSCNKSIPGIGKGRLWVFFQQSFDIFPFLVSTSQKLLAFIVLTNSIFYLFIPLQQLNTDITLRHT